MTRRRKEALFFLYVAPHEALREIFDDIRQFAVVVMRTGSEIIDWLSAVA
jgi:hypothetical protein